MRIQVPVLILLTIFGLSFGNNQAFAVNAPNFPACSNPQGTIKVSNPEGTHGIVGDTKEYTGSDTVYELDPNTLQQCFCSVDGHGVQTNWWRISSLDQEQLQVLKNSGWIYIPNGALWGLQETPYLAKNSDYTCGGNNNSNNNVGGPGDGRSDGLGCGSHDCSNQAGQVLGVSTGVLGLASTGGSYLPFVLAICGVLAITSGLLLNKKSRK